MAKKRATVSAAPVPGMVKQLPTITVELGPGESLPKYGTTCTVTIRGTVRNIEEGRHDWEPGKPHFRRVSVEYAKRQVHLDAARSVDDLERDNPSI